MVSIDKKKILWILGALVSFVMIYEVSLYLFFDKDSDYYQIDRCLDSGGCWDGVDQICRSSEINAQELCDRSKVNGKTLEQRIHEKIEKINPEN